MHARMDFSTWTVERYKQTVLYTFDRSSTNPYSLLPRLVQGCEACNCDSVGSINATCHVQTGQCKQIILLKITNTEVLNGFFLKGNCRPGVTGQQCDQCLPNHYGFSPDGCKPCECDQQGSTDIQCDLITGQCPCHDKVQLMS